ncbi:MAG: TetR family transcriptional regulator [Propionibacteriaceae bacterium]|nr:TetR family transcriptional regulator [Propionibacteriaceae bacterium]
MATRREQIVDAACVIAERSGLQAVTVRAVATAVGIGMGTLRHHFPSQGDLHAAVLEHKLGGAVDDSALQDQSLAPAEQLAACLQQLLPKDPEAHQMWFGMYRSGIGPEATEATREYLEATARRDRTRVTAWLAQLIDDGARLRPRERASRFRTAAEPLGVEEAAVMLNSLISGLRLELLTPGSELSADQARNLLAHVVADLIS